MKENKNTICDNYEAKREDVIVGRFRTLEDKQYRYNGFLAQKTDLENCLEQAKKGATRQTVSPFVFPFVWLGMAVSKPLRVRRLKKKLAQTEKELSEFDIDAIEKELEDLRPEAETYIRLQQEAEKLTWWGYISRE